MVTIRFSNALAFVLILFLHFNSIYTATFTVTNVSDSGAGSLRQAILDVNASGDATNDIVVALSGSGGSTIFLQSELPAITNQIHLDGKDQNSSELLTIDGSLLINPVRGLEINGASAAGSLIEYCVIQNFSTSSASPLYGIFITNAAEECSIFNCTVDTIARTNISSVLAGIFISDEVLYSAGISYNNIRNIGNLNVFLSPAEAYGILVDGDIGQGSIAANCIENVIENVFGRVEISGIRANYLYGNCKYNSITGLRSEETGPVIHGIYFENVYENISCNVISDLSSSFSFSPTQDVFGIYINDTVYGDVSYNNVTKLLCDDGSIVGISLEEVMGSILCNVLSDFSIVSDGAFSSKRLFGIRASGIVYGDFSGNCIKQLTSVLGEVFGIFANTVYGSVSLNQLSDYISEREDANGIVIAGQSGPLKCNGVSNVRSGLSGSGGFNGRDVAGIKYTNDIPLDIAITNNTITDLSTSGATAAGEVVGIHIPAALVSGVVSGNTISSLRSGTVEALQEQANGVLIRKANQVEFVCNTISDISGAGEDAGVNSGIFIFDGENLLFSSNIIMNIVSQRSTNTAHGIIGGALVSDEINSSLFEKNVINQVSAESLEAYGITVGGELSFNNQVLTNSISNIDTAAIFYKNSALTDGTVQLNLIECSGQSVTISGTIFPERSFFNTDFLVQFFASSLSSPEQIKFFFGEHAITVGDGPTPFTVSFELERRIFGSQFVTATATALPGGTRENFNTSVVSNVLVGCSTASAPGVCGMLATCPNDGLPFVDCPVIDCGTSECPEC